MIDINTLKVGDLFAYYDHGPLFVEAVGKDFVVARDPEGGLCFCTSVAFRELRLLPETKVIDWSKVKPGTSVLVATSDEDDWWESEHRFASYDPKGGENRFLLAGPYLGCAHHAKLAPTDWIFWKGGDQPVPDGVIVEVWYRDVLSPLEKKLPAEAYGWQWDGIEEDIIAYRITGELAKGYRWY